MKEYLNSEYCDFSNDASASSFGWNFQSNAGIFLFLKNIKESESIKIESRLQDIEIKMSNGTKILAQAKSMQDYSAATPSSKKDKFKDALISLAKFSESGEQLIYISNIPDTFQTANGGFNNAIVPYSSCLKAIKDEIDSSFDSVCQSVREKCQNEHNQKKQAKLKAILQLIERFDRSKLYISVISPYWGDDANRYSVISDTILSFLVDDIKLSREDAIAIRKKLLDYWQLTFQHNSSQPDKDTQKVISKETFAWPIAAFLVDDMVPDIDDCLTFTADQSLTNEVSRLLSSDNLAYHERFEFTNRIIQDYRSFVKDHPIGTKEIEKLYIKTHGNDYCDEFKIDNDDEKTEYLAKAFIYKILVNHRNMGKISSGIGAKI